MTRTLSILNRFKKLFSLENSFVNLQLNGYQIRLNTLYGYASDHKGHFLKLIPFSLNNAINLRHSTCVRFTVNHDNFKKLQPAIDACARTANYLVCSDVTESMVTIRSRFCGVLQRIQIRIRYESESRFAEIEYCLSGIGPRVI